MAGVQVHHPTKTPKRLVLVGDDACYYNDDDYYYILLLNGNTYQNLPFWCFGGMMDLYPNHRLDY